MYLVIFKYYFKNNKKKISPEKQTGKKLLTEKQKFNLTSGYFLQMKCQKPLEQHVEFWESKAVIQNSRTNQPFIHIQGQKKDLGKTQKPKGHLHNPWFIEVLFSTGYTNFSNSHNNFVREGLVLFCFVPR